MGSLQELISVGHRHTLEFFFLGLRDVTDAEVDRDELLYNASVLAHFAQVSTQAKLELPAPASLVDVFDKFVCGVHMVRDSNTMEVAGAQCLLLTGFFEQQMCGRHNIRWYADVGAGFFRRAARLTSSPAKAKMFQRMSDHFGFWRERHALLSRQFRCQARILQH